MGIENKIFGSGALFVITRAMAFLFLIPRSINYGCGRKCTKYRVWIQSVMRSYEAALDLSGYFFWLTWNRVPAGQCSGVLDHHFWGLKFIRRQVSLDGDSSRQATGRSLYTSHLVMEPNSEVRLPGEGG